MYPQNMIDTGDPSFLAPTDEDDDLLNQYYGNRMVGYPASMEEEQRMMNAVTPTFPVNPYFINNPMLQQHQAQMYGGASGYYGNGFGNVMIPGMGSRYFYSDKDEWMLPTEEEVTMGKVPKVTVIKGEPKEYLVRKPKEEIKVAVVKKHKDENGVEYDEFLYGDREAAHELPTVNSLDYKEAATISKRKELEEDTYALAAELRRYNSDLADNLLWYQQNVTNLDEFMQIRRDAQEQLIKYRNEDKLAGVKSTVIIAGDKTMVRPPKPTSMEELEKIAREELAQYLNKEKTERSENYVIDRYCDPDNAVKTQMKTILNSNSVSDIILKLQAFTDMRIVCAGEDENIFKDVEQKLSPINIDQKDNYLTWKRLMKGARIRHGDDVSNFDKEFDEWWNEPRVVTPEQKKRHFEKYRLRMTELTIDHFNEVSANQPSPEERGRRWDEKILKSWREFDEGVVTPNMGLFDFFKNANYLLTRKLEVEIKRQANKLTRLFDPQAYLAEVRRHSALRNYQDGKGYIPTMDLMDQKVYQDKRQRFIESIFKKPKMGSIT
jgi:hypothetical protein